MKPRQKFVNELAFDEIHHDEIESIVKLTWPIPKECNEESYVERLGSSHGAEPSVILSSKSKKNFLRYFDRINVIFDR